MTARTVRFRDDDPYGLWHAGDVAEDLGWESEHPDAPPIRLLRTGDGQVLSLTDPLGRGIVERVS